MFSKSCNNSAAPGATVSRGGGPGPGVLFCFFNGFLLATKVNLEAPIVKPMPSELLWLMGGEPVEALLLLFPHSWPLVWGDYSLRGD